MPQRLPRSELPVVGRSKWGKPEKFPSSCAVNREYTRGKVKPRYGEAASARCDAPVYMANFSACEQPQFASCAAQPEPSAAGPSKWAQTETCRVCAHCVRNFIRTCLRANTEPCQYVSFKFEIVVSQGFIVLWRDFHVNFFFAIFGKFFDSLLLLEFGYKFSFSTIE